MARVLRPGPGSLEGLKWLARVGPAPLEPWRRAMGWSEAAARSHARRLEAEGWLARYPMTRGSGSLFVATRNGVRLLGLPLRAAGAPAPTWWAHHSACAWAAAYVHLRGRRYLADRELLDDRSWSREVTWTDRKGLHTAGHRPDLVGAFPDGVKVTLEIELAHKSRSRLQAIISLHAAWRAEGRISGVLYVCGDRDCADRVRQAADVIVGPKWEGLKTRSLARLQEQVVQLSEQQRAERRRLDQDSRLQASGAA